MLFVTNVEMKQQQKAKNDCQKKQTMVDQENGNFLGPRKWKLCWTKKMETLLDQENGNNFANKKKRKQFYEQEKKKQYYEQENENNASVKKKEKTLVF